MPSSLSFHIKPYQPVMMGAALLIVLVTQLRFAGAGLYSLFPSELDTYWRLSEGLFTWSLGAVFIHAGTSVADMNELALRYISPFLILATASLGYYWVRQIRGAKAAFFTGLLLAVFPHAAVSATLYHPHLFVIPLFLMSFYAFVLRKSFAQIAIPLLGALLFSWTAVLGVLILTVLWVWQSFSSLSYLGKLIVATLTAVLWEQAVSSGLDAYAPRLSLFLAVILAMEAVFVSHKIWVAHVMIPICLVMTIFLYNLFVLQQAFPDALKMVNDPFYEARGWSQLGADVGANWAVYSSADLVAENKTIAGALYFYTVPTPEKVYLKEDFANLERKTPYLYVSSEEKPESILDVFALKRGLSQIKVPIYPAGLKEYYTFYLDEKR